MHTTPPSGSKRDHRSPIETPRPHAPRSPEFPSEGVHQEVVFSGDATAATGQLESCQDLRAVRFDGMNMAVNDASSLAGTLKQMPSLQSVSLDRCRMSAGDLSTLLDGMAGLPHLAALELVLDPVAAGEAGHALSPLRDQFIGLRCLRLASADLSAPSIAAIVGHLLVRARRGHALETLNLTGVPVESLAGWRGSPGTTHRTFAKRLELRDLPQASETQTMEILTNVLLGRGFATLCLGTLLSPAGLLAIELYRDKCAQDVAIEALPDKEQAGQVAESGEQRLEALSQIRRKGVRIAEQEHLVLKTQCEIAQMSHELAKLQAEIVKVQMEVAEILLMFSLHSPQRRSQ